MPPSIDKSAGICSPHIHKIKPWYREFWAWFILTPLIVVVPVSLYTVFLAVYHADDRVVDNYYQEGRMINQRMDEDLAAARIGLIADIRFDQDIGEMTVQLHHQQSVFPTQIHLELSHPSDQALDHQLSLQHIAKGHYQTELHGTLSYRWYLRLRSDSASANTVGDPWRLRGEIDFSTQSSVRLHAQQ